MFRIGAFSILALTLATPTGAAGNSSNLLRQASQTAGQGVMREVSGNRTGTMEQQGNARVVRDKSENTVDTIERQGNAKVIRDRNGNTVVTVDSR